MANTFRFETSSAVTGRVMPPEELIGRMGEYSWAESFVRLSSIAALIANSDGGWRSDAVRHATLDPLTRLTGSDVDLTTQIRSYVLANRDEIAIAHEQGISTLQHLLMLVGKEDGDGPAEEEIGLWLLGVNEHLGQLGEPDSRSEDRKQELIATSAWALRFNQRPDLLRELTRVYLLFSQRPDRGPFASPSAWNQLQAEAFGTSFHEYFQSFVFPLAVLSKSWSTDKHALPMIDAGALRNERGSAAKGWLGWIREMSVTRAAAQKAIPVKPDGLPENLLCLLHKPFVEVQPDRFVCVSPWAMLAQVKFGLWAKWLEASRTLLGGKGAKAWFTTFGDSFERWCADVALQAQAAKWFRGRLVLPSSPGAADEVEDVVLIEGRAAVLFSVKGRLVPEDVARRSDSHSKLIDWYDKYFFARPKGAFRGGVLRQLNKRIEFIRNGDFSDQVSPKSRLLPVVVTYDSLGEDVLLYRWLAKRCREEDLLQQKDVGPVTLARVDQYEELMARAANRTSVVGILRKRESSFEHHRLDALLFATRSGRPRRLKLMEDTFEELMHVSIARLSQTGLSDHCRFGRSDRAQFGRSDRVQFGRSDR